MYIVSNWSDDHLGECYLVSMRHRILGVTEFKAKCLSLLDEVGERGGTITITKRGRPLATVGPVRSTAWKSPEGAWTGKVTIAGDLLGTDTAQLWEVARREPGARD
jgi:prevent-host-death family protein